jgi:gas vesicle protein
MSEDTSSKITYFFCGLGLGAAVALLFAPKSGAETRELILTKADEGKEFLVRQGVKIRDSAGDVLKKGKNLVSKQKDQISAAFEAGKQAYQDALKEGGERAEAPEGV